MIGRPIRRMADGPLFALLGLAAVFVTALSAFIALISMPYDPLLLCQTAWTTMVAGLSTIGVMMPLGLAGAVVIAGVLAGAHQLVATRRMLRAVLARRRAPTAAELAVARAAGLEDRLVVVEDRHAYTFCFGLTDPRVCLSSGLADMLNRDELLAVLRHEAHHAAHYDPLKIFLGRAVASALFFLPLAGALRNGYLAGKEICADRDATDEGADVSLASALVKMLGADRPQWPAGVLAIGALTPTEARLHHLIDPGAEASVRPSPSDWIASATMVAGIFGFGLGSAATASAAPLHQACQTDIAAERGTDAVLATPSVLQDEPRWPDIEVPPADCETITSGADRCGFVRPPCTATTHCGPHSS